MPGWLAGLLGLAIPLTFWLFRWLGWPFWWVGVLLLPLLWRRTEGNPALRWIGPMAALLGLIALFGRTDIPVKLYPVMVNAALLAAFVHSLFYPPTVIERLARLSEPELPASGVAYTRKVTIAWSVFFALNGSVALITVLHGDDRVWALYNGLIAYVLMGLMFAVEWLIRLRVRRSHHG